MIIDVWTKLLAGHPWVQEDNVALNKPLVSTVLSRLKAIFCDEQAYQLDIRLMGSAKHLELEKLFSDVATFVILNHKSLKLLLLT